MLCCLASELRRPETSVFAFERARLPVECDHTLAQASLHRILARQEDLLLGMQPHLPPEMWPHYHQQLRAIQEEETKCAAIGKCDRGASERREHELKASRPASRAGADAARHLRLDAAGGAATTEQAASCGRGRESVVPEQPAATTGQWQVLSEGPGLARKPAHALTQSPQWPSPIPACGGRQGYEVDASCDTSEARQPTEPKRSPPEKHIEPKTTPTSLPFAPP